MQNLYKNEQRDTDPREALLKLAKSAETNPQWVAPAYKETQPKNIFNMSQSAWEAKRGD